MRSASNKMERVWKIIPIKASNGEALDNPIEVIRGKKVLLLSTIINSGQTLNRLIESLNHFNPKVIRTAVAFRKRQQQIENAEQVNLPALFTPNYAGFNLPALSQISDNLPAAQYSECCFIGYGIDCYGKFKDLPHLCVIN